MFNGEWKNEGTDFFTACEEILRYGVSSYFYSFCYFRIYGYDWIYQRLFFIRDWANEIF